MQSEILGSSILQVAKGEVFHQRNLVRAHAFRYHNHWVAFSVAQWNEVNQQLKGSPCHLNRQHYLATQSGSSATESLAAWFQKIAVDISHLQVVGVTQPSFLGVAFNPISLWLALDAEQQLKGLLVEVHNTPWGEKIVYPVAVEWVAPNQYQANFEKLMHVSPFMTMDHHYQLMLSLDAKRFYLSVENFQNEQMVFHAAYRGSFTDWLTMSRRERCLWWLSGKGFAFKSLLLIYFEALKLWLKRVPFISHPHSKKDSSDHV